MVDLDVAAAPEVATAAEVLETLPRGTRLLYGGNRLTNVPDDVADAFRPGDQVVVGQKLAMLEAMKMEATISAQSDGEVAEVHVIAGTQVETGDLLITLT